MPDWTVPAEFDKLVQRNGLEEALAHPRLDPHARSLVALTACALAGDESELAATITEAISNGVTEPEVVEVFLNLAIVAGLPAARQAFAAAQRTLTRPAPVPEADPGGSTPGTGKGPA